MGELPMAPANRRDNPPVRLEKSDHLAYLHRTDRLGAGVCGTSASRMSAGGGTRTPTGLSPRAPKARASDQFRHARVFRKDRGMRPEDVYALTSAGDPRLSPDGRVIAYVLTRIDREESAYRSAIWVVPVDGSEEPRQVTS